MRMLEPLRGAFIYAPIARDYRLKTEQEDGGYGRWLAGLFAYLKQRTGTSDPRVLDFGCGTGELSVLMRSLGLNVTGIDVHEKHLELARLLAEENGFDPAMFVENRSAALPFRDNSFDVVTMFVVLEHLDDALLEGLLPELKRVCRGAIFVLVPNKFALVDDHTGLRLVPWMPRAMAAAYVRLHGNKRRYSISAGGKWDVQYRGVKSILRRFARHGFRGEFVPDELVFPPLEVAPPIHRLGKTINLGGRSIFVGLPLPVKRLQRFWPKQAFYPYLNLVFWPEPQP